MYTNFVYDPARNGIDPTMWRTLYGTPSVASGVITVGSSVMAHRADLMRGSYVFRIALPVPADGEDARFGLYFYAIGAYIIFDVTNTTFSAKVSDGTNAESSTITWNSSWSSAYTDYKIQWEASQARFYINGVQVAILSAYVPAHQLSLWIQSDSENSNSLLFKMVEAQGVVSYHLEEGISSVSGGTYGTITPLSPTPVRFDAVTVSEFMVMSVPLPVRSPFDLLTLTESVSLTIV